MVRQAIAHHGLITRLIQKEKDISELRKEVDKLIASGASVPESKDSVSILHRPSVLPLGSTLTST